MGENTKQIASVAEPAIFRAIAGVIADVGAVAKDKVNKQQGFKFRSIDDVYNALHPALAKNKVFIVPRILEQTREVVGKTQKGTNMTLVICKIKFTFYAEDGSNIESVIIGEGLDTGDKATNKAMAIAYKYACFQVFCIPTEEMVDPDAERPEMEMEQPTGKKNGQAKTSDKKTKEDPSKQNPPADPEGSQSEAKPTDPITPAMLQTIRAEQARTGVTDKIILGRKQVKSKSVETMTIEEFKYIMSVFKITPDKKGNQNE